MYTYNLQNSLLAGISNRGFALLYNCTVEMQIYYTNTFKNELSICLLKSTSLKLGLVATKPVLGVSDKAETETNLISYKD